MRRPVSAAGGTGRRRGGLGRGVAAHPRSGRLLVLRGELRLSNGAYLEGLGDFQEARVNNGEQAAAVGFDGTCDPISRRSADETTLEHAYAIMMGNEPPSQAQGGGTRGMVRAN